MNELFGVLRQQAFEFGYGCFQAVVGNAASRVVVTAAIEMRP